MAARQKLFQLELNEINFEFVQRYGDRGELPNLNGLIAKHGLIETTSENIYEELEPWIQWVTAHTGLGYAEHGVFRLGDIVEHNHQQIWEWLESYGLTVGAVSPMNANNKTRAAAFFVPDPWTATAVTGGNTLKALAAAISEAVNENATSRFSAGSAIALLRGAAHYGGLTHWLSILSLAAKAASGQPWCKALILEELLWAVARRETRAKRPDFVSLFMNAGAHIQHHYMFNSAVYDGPHRNPDWLIAADKDPILAVYRLYDRILQAIAKEFPEYRLIVATGLHQNPYPRECYYWRLKDHAAFLTMIGCKDFSVQPRMSRDFLVQAGTLANAAGVAELLASARSADGEALFEIDNRGKDLFVMLVYPKLIANNTPFTVAGEVHADLRSHVSFVALKNGEHDGLGYLIDTAELAQSGLKRVELRSLPSRIAGHFGLEWPNGFAPPDTKAA